MPWVTRRSTLSTPTARSGGTLGNRSYFLEGEHLESVEIGGTLVERYFRGVGTDELVAGWLLDTDGKTKPFLFHHDQVTSTTAVTGHNGGTIQSVAYGAFGNTLSNAGSSPNRLKYTGREDDQTGLYYYRARYYDPAIKRFVSEDPAAFKAGINFYAYCSNSPIDCSDPSGLVDWRGIGKSTIDILGNGAGLVTGGVLTVGGAALIAAPEPTMVSKVAGGATFAAGVANIANSGPGLVNAGRNLVRAIQDNPTTPANLPTSGTTILADTFFPGNQNRVVDRGRRRIAGNLRTR